MPTIILTKTKSMNTITRIRIEERITGLLTEAMESEANQGLTEAIELAVLEFDRPEEIKPLLEVVYDSCDSADEVLKGWANILDDYAKVV